MKKAVAEKVYDIFMLNVIDSRSNTKDAKIQNILDSIKWKNETKMDFFVKVKNSLEIPILLIEVELDETYQVFRLESNKWEFSNVDDIINFEAFLLIYKFNQDYDIVGIFTEDDSSDIKIIKLVKQYRPFLNEIGIDFLMRYPKSSKLRFMSSFIELHSQNSYGKTLFQVLYENDRNDAIEFLLQNECQFPRCKIARGISLIEKRLKSNLTFHELLKEGKFDAIDKFLEVNLNQQYIFNENNKSACWVAAMVMRNFKLFRFLCKRSFTLTDEEITDLKNNKDFFLTNTFTGLDLKNNLQILESKTLTTNKLATDFSVDDIYKELRKIPNVNLILNIFNKYRNIFINIDYQDSISSTRPYIPKLPAYYCSYSTPDFMRIFISNARGTKQLLGTFAFEITYWAMRLVYQNLGKPYYSKDDKSQNYFNEIVEVIRQKVSNRAINDEIIKSVFDHSERYWHSELISRVNYVLAFYGQDRGNQILQQKTPELFTFYEIYVKPDLEKYLHGHFNHNYNLFNTKWHEYMECQNLYSHDLDNLSEFIVAVYSKNVMIQSSCVAFTCLKLFNNITKCIDSPFNIDNTYFIDLETFSNNNYEIIPHLPQCELLILFEPFFVSPPISNEWKNVVEYLNKVGKRYIFVFDMKGNLFYQGLSQVNVVPFTDSLKPTKIDRNSKKLIFDTFEVKLQGEKLKLRELINFEEYLHILSKSMPEKMLNYFFSELRIPEVVGRLFLVSHYVNRKFKTTICELDELRDEIVEKYVCDNITDESTENHFEIKTKNDKIVTFPGKRLRIKEDYKPVNVPMKISSENSKKVYNDMDSDIFIISLKIGSKSFIIIDEEKEIEINNFSYSDMETFSKNNNKFNIHWFVESDTSQYFFHHLKTFGSFDKARSFCYREKSTINEEDLLKKLQHQKVVLIAAPAGMGKTETIKSMARNLVKNDSSIWTPYVVLRKCTEILKTFCPENSDPDYLFDFLAELLKYHDFEKEMFKIFCRRQANKVCLLLDGADENGPEYTDIIIELIKRLSQTSINHIILTTRLIGKFEFEFKLETIAIEMEPFSYDKKIECLVDYWTNYNESWYDKINQIQIARRVVKHFRNFGDFLNSPLQIELVANICQDQLEKFTKNFINIYFYFKDQLSLIEMYKKFIAIKMTPSKAKKTLALLKGSTLTKTPQHQLQYAAIRVLLNDDDMELFLTSEEILSHKNYIKVINNWQDCEGIIDRTFSEKLDFVHRTYAEYFYADFLLHKYEVWNEKTEQFFFDHILVKKEFEYVRKFLNSYTGTSDLLSRKPTYFQIPATLHDAVTQNIEENNMKILQYLHTLAFNLNIYPSPLITKYINNTSPNSIEKLIETIKFLVETCGDVYLSINELRQNKKILHRILLQDRIELIKALLQCKLIDLDDDGLSQDQAKSFQSLWNEAKTKFVEDPENKDSKKLLALFNEILQMINI